MGRKPFLFLLLFIGFFLIFQTADAAGLYYYENINVEIQVNKDSTFDVLENQTYFLDGNFGYFNRDIALKDLDRISDVQVIDSDGNIVTSPDIQYKGNSLHVQWNFERRDFIQELKSWTIKYKVHGGLGFYKDHDEIYWNAIFPDRDVEIAKAKITVYLPQEIQGDIQAKMFVGESGRTKESYDYLIKDKTVEFLGYKLQPSEFLTIVVWWPKGFIEKPLLYVNQIIVLAVILLSILIILSTFIFTYIIWSKKGKDAKINKTIIAQYEPPKNITPALAGAIIRQSVDVKEILATIVDLSVRKYLRIVEEQKGFSIFKFKEYTFEKRSAGEDLSIIEKKIFDSLFANKDTITTAELKNKFYQKLPGINKTIYKEIAKTNFFNGNIQQIRRHYSVLWIALIAVSGICLFLGPALATGTLNLSPIISASIFILSASLLISGIIGLIFSFFMPALTKEGAEIKWQLLGFREYLNTAEKFRLEVETLDTFSKFLPYAIVFGVEKQWVERFSYFDYQQQSWFVPAAVYSGPSGLPSTFSELSSSISSFSDVASSIFSSSPGGGGAGGGSAGGGGGGGGGGAG
jgi:hypothetical protein